MKCKYCGKPIRLSSYGDWLHIRGEDFCSLESSNKAVPEKLIRRGR